MGKQIILAAIVLSGIGLTTQSHAQDMAEAIAEAAGIPQIPAFLPDKYSVARSEALPIDGVWLISTIRKKIRIEQGRAYAVDSWLHMFVLKVMPDMVVMQNFRRIAPGKFAADDLPLVGPAELTVNAQGNIDAVVQSMFGPVRYGLTRLEAQYPDHLTAEIQAATGQQATVPVVAPISPAPIQAPAPQPVQQPIHQPIAQPAPIGTPVAETPANCTPIGVDPDTGETICAH